MIIQIPDWLVNSKRINSQNHSWMYKDGKSLSRKLGAKSKEEFEQEIIKIAKQGKKRPSQKTKIGLQICYFTNPNHPRYNKEFANKIKKIRPDWFRNSSDIAKKKLIEMARKGKDKPNIKTSLGRKFYRYAIEKGSCFDPDFKEDIKKANSSWLNTGCKKVESKKQKLIGLLKNKKLKISDFGDLKCSFYYYMKNDKGFRNIVQKLRPDLSFFIREKIEKPRTFNRKNKITNLLRNKTPKSKFSHEDKMAIKRYTTSSSSFDPKFTKTFKKLAPNWKGQIDYW